MDKGETTPDQDKRFIRAMSKVSYELDRSIRGDKKAKQTRDEAEKLANAGVDPDSNLNLDANETSSTDEGHVKELVETEAVGGAEEVLRKIEALADRIEKGVDQYNAKE